MSELDEIPQGDSLSTVFEALADERRIAILRLLSGGGRCVCDVSESLEISSALASHHIKKLRQAGLVRTSRRGVWLHCALEPTALRSAAETLRELARAAEEADAHAAVDDAARACCAGCIDDKEVAVDV